MVPVPVTVKVKVAVPPKLMVWLPEIDAVGKTLTVAVTVKRLAEIHPLSLASAYKVVVEPIVVGVTTNEPPTGESYQVIVPALAVAVKLTEPPPQSVEGLTEAELTNGNAVTVTVTVAELVHPLPSVPTTA